MRLTQYDKQVDRTSSKTGSPTKPAFKMKVDVKGRRKLIADGIINIYEQIQSHKDSCDINLILTKYMNGDKTVLSKVQGFYGDYTNIPTSLNELQNRVLDAERLFYQLPIETREKFEHNPGIFYNMVGSDAFNEILGLNGTDKSKDSPLTPPSDVTVQKGEITDV